MDKSRAARGQRKMMGDNCVERCLYNIPETSCMILIPGVSLLVTGAVLTGIMCGQGACDDDLSYTDYIMLGLGGVITLAGIILILVVFIRSRRHRTSNNKTDQSAANLLSAKRVGSIQHVSTYSKPVIVGVVQQQAVKVKVAERSQLAGYTNTAAALHTNDDRRDGRETQHKGSQVKPRDQPDDGKPAFNSQTGVVNRVNDPHAIHGELLV